MRAFLPFTVKTLDIHFRNGDQRGVEFDADDPCLAVFGSHQQHASLAATHVEIAAGIENPLVAFIISRNRIGVVASYGVALGCKARSPWP
jgi:hypothetical protein